MHVLKWIHDFSPLTDVTAVAIALFIFGNENKRKLANLGAAPESVL